jgi:dTDP-4-amino-4,6-dideoxygalactose transaminase
MNDKIWLSSPHMGGNERKFVTEAFDTNWVAPLGPNVKLCNCFKRGYSGHTFGIDTLGRGSR